ncbi:hypothetical protein ACH5RR_038301 [Cinchona calisaya]|uniref:Uncharacterized protein n=1 Tax=Cinchona calisaya TaxID=153742 RepID=A0ABD2XW89_9GENT
MTTTTTATRVSAFLYVPTKPCYIFVNNNQVVIFTAKLRTVPLISSHAAKSASAKLSPLLRFASTSSTPAVEDEEEEDQEKRDEPTFSDNDQVLEQEPQTPSSVRGCQACGKEEIERGCNGEGRIQGGIATVPGFGWWPIKAYRPCPSYVATGGRYRRTGQSMDEIGFGGGGREASAGSGGNSQSSNKKQRPKKSKS